MEKAIADLALQISADRRDATDQREAMAKAHDAVQKNVAFLRADMDTVKQLAEKWRTWQYVGFGAMLTVGAIGAGIGAGFTYFKFWLFGVRS